MGLKKFALITLILELTNFINGLDKGCSLEIIIDPFFHSYFKEKYPDRLVIIYFADYLFTGMLQKLFSRVSFAAPQTFAVLFSYKNFP